MFYPLAADAVVILHLAFIVFVLLGGVGVLFKPWLAAVHLPSMIWGAVVELFHLYCPLTPLENSLRARAGEHGYAGGFVEHYLVPIIYPSGLTPQIQLWLGGGVLLINALVYGILLARLVRRRSAR